jgi:hypothetical protein
MTNEMLADLEEMVRKVETGWTGNEVALRWLLGEYKRMSKILEGALVITRPDDGVKIEGPIFVTDSKGNTWTLDARDGE